VQVFKYLYFFNFHY